MDKRVVGFIIRFGSRTVDGGAQLGVGSLRYYDGCELLARVASAVFFTR